MKDNALQFLFASVMIAAIVLFVPSRVLAVPRVLITIDVESNEAFPLPQQVDAVCQGGSECGLMHISKMLSERGLAATFFLNVYEYKRWGRTAMRNIAVHLQAAGHDVGLHTHPQWAYDPHRWAMYQYSLDEQTAIVRDGLHLLESWTGRPVVSHRTGAYAADEQTMQALRRNGIKIDSSLFMDHPWCRLNGLGLPSNVPSVLDGVVQIPITVYRREMLPDIFPGAFSPVQDVRKIDPDWLVNEREAEDAMTALVRTDIPFLVVMMHSFSFMKPPEEKGGPPVLNRHAMKMFKVILDYVKVHHLKTQTMRNLAESGELDAALSKKDVVPRVKVYVEPAMYLWHRMKLMGRSEQVMIIGAIALILSVSALAAALKIRKSRASTHPGKGGS